MRRKPAPPVRGRTTRPAAEVAGSRRAAAVGRTPHGSDFVTASPHCQDQARRAPLCSVLRASDVEEARVPRTAMARVGSRLRITTSGRHAVACGWRAANKCIQPLKATHQPFSDIMLFNLVKEGHRRLHKPAWAEAGQQVGNNHVAMPKLMCCPCRRNEDDGQSLDGNLERCRPKPKHIIPTTCGFEACHHIDDDQRPKTVNFPVHRVAVER
mmetsp:Transcript_41398/g.128692  ORF Transcript_41398/g.128692 Transcript_41398/m.128692 type:complete len:212 (+) Transcript_41398:147-782(+)